MLKCRELSRLQKSPRFSSILWKHQTPGSAAALLGGSRRNAFLDPSHPATQTGSRGLPYYNVKEMTVKVYPMALLETHVEIYPFRRPFVTWDQRVQRAKEAGFVAIETKGRPTLFRKGSSQPVGLEQQVYPEDEKETLRRARLPECRAIPSEGLMGVALKRAQSRVPMSFFVATSKTRMGSLRCRRRIITLRIKAALNLIVTRGAYYDHDSPGTRNRITSSNTVKPNDDSKKATSCPSPVMQFNNKEAESMGRRWILQGWSYVFSPTMEVLRMPYSKLIPMLRTILTSINARAIELENNWLARSLLHEQRLSLRGAKTLRPVSQGLSQPPIPDSGRPKLKSGHPIIPATAPVKKKPSFDSAVWRLELEAQLKLLSQNSLTESGKENLPSDEKC